MKEKTMLDILKKQKKISLIEYKLLKDFYLLQNSNPEIMIQLENKNYEILRLKIQINKHYL